MQEIWRALAPGGEMIVIVPSRMGLWSHGSGTPFGYGQPFSQVQLRHLLQEAQLTISGVKHALLLPPIESPPMLRAAPWAEMLGRHLWWGLGGVLMMRARRSRCMRR